MIQPKIHIRLLKEEIDKTIDRQRSGKWSPSSFGKCYRAQYWNRLNEPKTHSVPVETLCVFKVGNLIHKFYQDALREEYQREVLVETTDTLGYADLVNKEEVVDIKSVRSYQYKLMGSKKVPYDFKAQNKENIMQVTYYGKELGRPKGRLVFVDKDSLNAIEFEFDIAEFVPVLTNELDKLNGYWIAKTLPPAEPRCYNGKECSYCGWSIMDKCKEE